MSSLFEDIEIDVVKITFTKRDNSTTSTYYFSTDYYEADAVYSGNPIFYPLLAGSPNARREVGINLGIKTSVDIQLFGNNDFTAFNYSLNDFLKEYEKNTADVEIRYYCKPKSAVTTHDDDINIRQTLKVTNSSYDDSSGILTLSCQDVWFKDKEVSKKLSSEIFPNLDPRYDGVYGAIVFGQATTAANGIAIDAPFISSEINGIEIPEAKIFSGWTFLNHPNKQKRRLLVRNNNRFFKRNEWTEVELMSDPQVAGAGDAINLASLYADPVSHDRDLSINERALVYGTSETQGNIVTSVRAGLKLPEYDRCLDITSTQYLWNPSNPDFLSRGDEDFSFSFWVNFDALSGMVCQQGWDDSSKMEWAVYHDGSNHLTFSISSTGSGIAHSVTSGTVSTGTWYYVTCVYDTSVNNKIYIYLNTTATNTTITNFLTARNGRFVIGRPSANAGLDGKMYQFRYWKRALSSSDVSGLYNSGVPIFFKDLSDAQKIDITASWPMNEPVGNRIDEHSSSDLVENAQSGGSPIVRYSYSNKSITVDNSYGELSLEVYHAESLDGGNAYAPVGSILSKSTIDLTKTNADTGSLLTTGTQNVFFQIDPPIVMSEFTNFIFILKYDNDKTNTYFVLSYYSSETPTFDHMLKAKRKIEDGANTKQAYNKETAAMLDLQAYFLGDNSSAWVDGTVTGNDKYSYQGLEAKSVTLMDGMEQVEFNKDLEFKICIDGIEDDGSGTYTGSANALIENPSDVIRFLLLDSEFGLGLSSTDIDEDSFDSVRDSLTSFSLNKLKIVINAETTAEDLIAEICKQARIVFYKNKKGKLALYYPTNLISYDYVLSEAELRESGQLMGFKEKDYSSIINKCLQYYKPDIFNIPEDPSLLRLEERERLVGKLELDASSSTMADDDRQAVATISQAVYDIRELTFDLSFYDEKQTAYKVQKYYFDRYSELQKQATYKVSRKKYLALDLFDKVKIQDTALQSTYQAGIQAKCHYDGQEIATYYEGTPIVVWSGGTIEGEVVAIQEQGSELLLTIETMNAFED